MQVGSFCLIDGHPRVPMSRVIGWELDVLGSHGMAATDYPGMLALIEAGSLQPQRLIERTIGLDEAADPVAEVRPSDGCRHDHDRSHPLS